MEMAISLRGDSLLEFPVHLTENADRSQSEKDKKKGCIQIVIIFLVLLAQVLDLLSRGVLCLTFPPVGLTLLVLGFWIFCSLEAERLWG